MKGLPIWMKSELASLATAVSGSSRKWRKQSYHVQDAQQHQKQQRKLKLQQNSTTSSTNKTPSVAADHIVLSNNEISCHQSAASGPVLVTAMATRSAAPVFAWAEDVDPQNNKNTQNDTTTNYGAQLAADCAELVVKNENESTVDDLQKTGANIRKPDNGSTKPPQSSSGASSASRSLPRTINGLSSASHDRRRAPLILPNNSDDVELQDDNDLSSPLLPPMPLPNGFLNNAPTQHPTLNPLWNYEVASSASRRLQNQIDQLSEMLAAVDVDQQQQELFNLTMLPDPTNCSGSILNGYVFAKKPPEVQEQDEIIQSPVLPDLMNESSIIGLERQTRAENGDEKVLRASLADPNLLLDTQDGDNGCQNIQQVDHDVDEVAAASIPPPLPEKLRTPQASRQRLRAGNKTSRLLLPNSPQNSTAASSEYLLASSVPVFPSPSDIVRPESAAIRRLPTPPESNSTTLSSPEQAQNDRHFKANSQMTSATLCQLSDEQPSDNSDAAPSVAPLRVEQHRHLIKHFELLAAKAGGIGGGGIVQSDEQEHQHTRPLSLHQEAGGDYASSSAALPLSLPGPQKSRAQGRKIYHMNSNNIGRSASLHEVRLPTTLTCAKTLALERGEETVLERNAAKHQTSQPADEQSLNTTKSISTSQQHSSAVRPSSLFVSTPTTKSVSKPPPTSDSQALAWQQLQRLLEERRSIVETEYELNPSNEVSRDYKAKPIVNDPSAKSAPTSKQNPVFDENFYKSRDIQRYLTATESFRQNFLLRRRRLLMREQLQLQQQQLDRRRSTLPKAEKTDNRDYDEADDATGYTVPTAANPNSVKRRKSTAKSGAKAHHHHHHSYSYQPNPKSSMTSLLLVDNDSYYNGSNASFTNNASLQRRHSRRHNERVGKTLERRCERLEKSVFTLTRSLAYVSAQLHQQSVQLRTVHNELRSHGLPPTTAATNANTAATNSAMLARPATTKIHHPTASSPANGLMPVTVHALPAHVVHAAAAQRQHQQQHEQLAAASVYAAAAAKPVRRAHQPQPQAPQQLVPPANMMAPSGSGRTQVIKSSNVTTASSHIDMMRPERKLAERVTRLTRFFGDEPPLLQNFLKRLGYEKYYSLFEAEAVGMAELPYMTDERLRTMGIPLGPRARILREAQNPIELAPNVSMYIV